MSTVSVLREVRAERRAQDIKHGAQQSIPDGTSRGFSDQRDNARALTDRRMELGTHTWLDILREEVMEAAAEEDPVKLREELIQSAAVCVKWVEAIDRRAT